MLKKSCPPTQPLAFSLAWLVPSSFLCLLASTLDFLSVSPSLCMHVYMYHLIEVHALAVIGEQIGIILRKLPHNLVRTQGFELRCVRLNTEVANLRPGKRQTEQEETDLTQRRLHPIPSPGSCVCQQMHGKSGRKENESAKLGATVLSLSLLTGLQAERGGCSNNGWWCSNPKQSRRRP